MEAMCNHGIPSHNRGVSDEKTFKLDVKYLMRQFRVLNFVEEIFTNAILGK